MKSGLGFKRNLFVLAVAVSMMGPAVAPSTAADEPIRIGAFFALSGPASTIGTPTKLVAQLVVDKINKQEESATGLLNWLSAIRKAIPPRLSWRPRDWWKSPK